MMRKSQLLLAWLRFLRRPTRRFAPMALAFAALIGVGGMCFHTLYLAEPISFLRGLYLTYALVFMEHVLPFPEHWLLQLFYVALPPLGLVVVLDGLVQFGFAVLRRDASDPQWNRAMSETLREHIVLCGLGKAGLRTLEYLLHLGEQVAVLEKDPDCPNLAFARQQGVPVIVGDSRQAGILHEVNLAGARSIILATDNDLANLELALDAKKLKPDIHVVLRVFDQELASKIRDSLGIPMALSTTAMAAPLFATASIDPSVKSAFELGGRLLVVGEIAASAGGGLVGRTLGELSRTEGVFVLSLRRAGQETYRPEADATIAAGDVLTVQGEGPALKRIGALAAARSHPGA